MVKKQHYVPRLLLRRFATDEEQKLVNIYLLKHKKILYEKGLKNQAYGWYLYGADQILERAYQEIENGFSSSLRRFDNNDLCLNREDEAHLRFFIMFQKTRTPASVSIQNEWLDKFTKNLSSHDMKLKNRIDQFYVEFTDPYKFIFNITAETIPFCKDLQYGLLINETKVPFLIGEHPVVSLNPFLFDRNWHGSRQGIGVKGAVLILPISPTRSIILYDSERYKFRNFKRIISLESDDIDKLNECQILQSVDCVYFNQEIDTNYLDNIADRTREYRESDKSNLEVFEEKGRKKRIHSELVMMGNKPLPIEDKFSFLGQTHLATFENLGDSMDIRREAVKIQELMIGRVRQTKPYDRKDRKGKTFVPKKNYK
jgi:Protein of unknown function (DUF4238)